MRLVDADKIIMHLADWALAEAPDERTDNKVKKYTEHDLKHKVWETIQWSIQAVEDADSPWKLLSEEKPKEGEFIIVLFMQRGETVRGTGQYFSKKKKGIDKPWLEDEDIVAWMPYPDVATGLSQNNLRKRFGVWQATDFACDMFRCSYCGKNYLKPIGTFSLPNVCPNCKTPMKGWKYYG